MKTIEEQQPERLLLHFNEAATLLGVCLSTFYELVNEGQIPVVSIGRARRVSKTSLFDWIKAQEIYQVKQK